MKFSARKGEVSKESCDVLIVSAFEGFKTFGGATADVDQALKGLLIQIAKEEMFKGEMDSSVFLYTHGLIPAKRVLLIGLGKEQHFNEEAVREASAHALQKARGVNAKHIVCLLHGAGHGNIPVRQSAKAIVEGMMLGSYEFVKHQSKKPKINPQRIEFVTKNASVVSEANEGIALGELFAKATMLARNLVNEPSIHMSPAHLVAATKEMVKETEGKIQLKIYNRAQLQKMGAGGILGVAQGSDQEPFLVHMIYKPTKAKKRVAFVGKAITFDSGGLSLKPAEFMEEMKIDMAGSAAVIGTMSALAVLKPNVEVHGIYGACENMPSGKAMRPGDVLKAMNGKTMEVLNTDAEGRLTLADTLTYAVKQKPDMIVDLATLTGACMIALGEEIGGLMSNNRDVVKRLLDASAISGEFLWELPLQKRYKKMLKSHVADLANISSPRRYAGAITAGLFLEEFVSETPWAHLDIAGPAFAERPVNAYTRHGASGFGVRTLLELVRGLSQE